MKVVHTHTHTCIYIVIYFVFNIIFNYFTYFLNDCLSILLGTSNDKLKNAHMTCSPDPPQVNEKITVYVSGILSKICVCGVYKDT